MTARITKTQLLIRYMRAEDWQRALSLANTFRMLGTHRDTIRLAHECRVWPKFYRSLGRDPEEAVAAGIAALKLLYPERTTP
jgi:lipopolysaccharide biosynthesis regulator YciM